jgi:hypothetical protein
LIVLLAPAFASAFNNLQEQVQYYQELYSHPETTTVISQSRMKAKRKQWLQLLSRIQLSKSQKKKEI